MLRKPQARTCTPPLLGRPHSSRGPNIPSLPLHSHGSHAGSSRRTPPPVTTRAQPPGGSPRAAQRSPLPVPALAPLPSPSPQAVKIGVSTCPGVWRHGKGKWIPPTHTAWTAAWDQPASSGLTVQALCSEAPGARAGARLRGATPWSGPPGEPASYPKGLAGPHRVTRAVRVQERQPPPVPWAMLAVTGAVPSLSPSGDSPLFSVWLLLEVWLSGVV